MKYLNNETLYCSGMTIVEIIVAMSIMVIIFAVIVPLFRNIHNNWDSKAAVAETLQNGRVLTDHLSRNLAKAVKIMAVSESNETDGYIEFEDNDANTLRYDIGVDDYVEFGPVGNLSELAGPVSNLQFTCYDAYDLNTPLSSPVDVNSIRLVKAETTFTNFAALGQDKTFITSVYLRTNWQSSSDCNSDANLVGWWKLNETSGLTAEDSSGFDNDGTLTNMTGDEWTNGAINGALEFDGSTYGGGWYGVNCGNNSIFDITDEITVSAWIKPNDCGNGGHNPYVVKGDYSYGLKHTDTDKFEFYIKADGDDWYLAQYPVDESFNGIWHHLAGTYDGNQVKLYVNGELEATVDYVGSIQTDTSYLYIADHYERSYRYYDGIIDDVRIYNRALGPEEIAELASAVRYMGFNEARANSDTTSITILTPDTNEGDLLIAAVATDADTSLSLAPPGGEGWTEIEVEDYGGEVTLGAWWKFADASESASHQFTWTGDEQAYGWIMRFIGQDLTDPINDYSYSGESSSTPTSPAVIPTVNNSMILRLGAFDGDDITMDAPGLSRHATITMDRSAVTGGQVIYESYAEASESSDTTSIEVSKPSGTVQGDLLIASFVSNGSCTLSAPGGWTLIKGGGVNPVDNTPSFGVWYKIAGASEPSSYTFTSSASEELYIAVIRYTGHNPSAPINASEIANSTGSITPTAPSVTTTVDNCKILRVFGADDDDTPYGPPVDHTARYDGISGTGSGTCGGAGADTDQASAGSTGTAEFSQNASEEWRAVTVAIAPLVVTGGTVSGGAGYVTQSSIGSSGTSTFTLNSASEARMLTIAIEPEGASSCGSGSINP